MTPTEPTAESTGSKVTKIAAIVLLGGVALCGIAGTCLFVVLLAVGAFAG